MSESVRVDAWLWAVRVYKSRSLATAAVKAGHVQVDGVRAKPSTLLRPGVRVVVRGGERNRILVVQQLLSKRVSAPLAAAAMIDESPAPPPREERAAPVALGDRGAGRPDEARPPRPHAPQGPLTPVARPRRCRSPMPVQLGYAPEAG